MKRIISFFANTFIILGILFLLVGSLFKLKEWPDLFNGIYLGLIFISAGVILTVIIVIIGKKDC